MSATLHSRYNPQSEAERYIAALDLQEGAACFILIEPGMGHIIPVLQGKFPQSGIIVLHADRDFQGRVQAEAGLAVWYPGEGLGLEDFLAREIPEAQAASTRIIEWRPALGVYGERYAQLLSGTAEYIRRACAEQRTAEAFGKRWVRNFFKNTALMERALAYKTTEVPVIVTGSGPGLEQSLPQIKRMRERVLLVAASSSLLSLASAGIAPDIVISADGGSWALQHLYSCFRETPAASGAGGVTGAGPTCPVLAAALCAALPSQCAAFPFLVLNDGSLWQNIVLHELGVPSIIAPQRGTVSASAIDLALALSSGGVYLAGMDLSLRDIRTHARPYGFDYLFFGSASRLRPAYSQIFARAKAIHQGGSHRVYAAWFKNQLASWPRRVFSLGGNNQVFEAVESRELHCRNEKPGKNYFTGIPLKGGGAERRQRGLEALKRALNDERYAKTLNGELAPLLFPGKNGADNGEIREALEGMNAAYGGRGGR